MSFARGVGLYLRRDRYGLLPKCPHCDKTDIPKVNKFQVTCGGFSCQEKQNLLKARKLREKRKGKRA